MTKVNLHSYKGYNYHWSVDAWIYKDKSIKVRSRFSVKGDKYSRDKEILLRAEWVHKLLDYLKEAKEQ